MNEYLEWASQNGVDVVEGKVYECPGDDTCSEFQDRGPCADCTKVSKSECCACSPWCQHEGGPCVTCSECLMVEWKAVNV